MTKTKRVSQILILLLLLAAMALGLKISSGRVRLIFSLLTVLALGAALLPSLRGTVRPSWLKYAGILGAVLVALALNSYYNRINLDLILPFSGSVNQEIYQEENRADGTYPDVCVRQLIRDKTVRFKYAPAAFDTFNEHGDEEERGAQFRTDYYNKNNYARFFTEYAKTPVVDDTMPTIYDLKTAENEGMELREGFTDLGLANDMLRYTFLLNPDGQKESAYFWYSWYYYSFYEEKKYDPHVYVMEQECESSDTIVAVWDRKGNLFLMDPEVYEERFARLAGEWGRQNQ